MPRPTNHISQYVSRRLIGLRLQEIEQEEEERTRREEYNRKRRERYRVQVEKKRQAAAEAEKREESAKPADEKSEELDRKGNESESRGGAGVSIKLENGRQPQTDSKIEAASDHPELLNDDPRIELPPDRGSKEVAVVEPKEEVLVTPEWPSIAHEVEPYQMLRTLISADEEDGRSQILVFCTRIFDLPKMDGTDAERHNEREVRIKRGSPLITYRSPVLFEAAVAAGGVSSSKLRIALDWAMLLPEDHYLAFRIWLESLESWLYARLTSTPEGRAILAVEIARILAEE